MRAALHLARAAKPKRLIAAVPVGPPDTIATIQDDCNALVCLETPASFRAVGLHYRHFDQVTDAEVTEILRHHAKKRVPASGHPTPHDE